MATDGDRGVMMFMPVAITSRMALLETVERLAGLQREVWVAIKEWRHPHVGPSIQDLATLLGRKEASICGRIAELRDAGAIEDGPIKMGTCGKQVKTYRAVVWRAPENANRQMELEI